MRWPTVLAAGLFLSIGGCIIVDDGNGGGDGGGDGPTKIRVVVINQTGTSIDPEVYVSATPVDVNGLFADANKFTAYGFRNTGLLAAFAQDTFSINCDAARVLGTKGGTFGDDPANPLGTGTQRVFTQDLTVACGETLTLVYSRSLGGDFETTYTVTP